MRGPNMDYCAFENTTLAMEQLIDMMRDAQEEGITDFFNSMSRSEMEAFRNIYEVCERLQHAVVEAQEQFDSEARAEHEAETEE